MSAAPLAGSLWMLSTGADGPRDNRDRDRRRQGSCEPGAVALGARSSEGPQPGNLPASPKPSKEAPPTPPRPQQERPATVRTRALTQPPGPTGVKGSFCSQVCGHRGRGPPGARHLIGPPFLPGMLEPSPLPTCSTKRNRPHPPGCPWRQGGGKVAHTGLGAWDWGGGASQCLQCQADAMPPSPSAPRPALTRCGGRTGFRSPQPPPAAQAHPAFAHLYGLDPNRNPAQAASLPLHSRLCFHGAPCPHSLSPSVPGYLALPSLPLRGPFWGPGHLGTFRLGGPGHRDGALLAEGPEFRIWGMWATAVGCGACGYGVGWGV